MNKYPFDELDLTRKEIKKLNNDIKKRLAEIEDSPSLDSNGEPDLAEQMEIFKRNNLKLSSKEVATMLGCTRQEVRSLRANGELISFGYNDVMKYIQNSKG